MDYLQKNQQRYPDIQFITEHVSSILSERSDVAAAYLLGSAVTGNLREDSDIDIALLPVDEQLISLQSRLEIAAQFERKFNRTTDIGVITTKNLIYASEAILNGYRIITLQKDYAEAMETRLLGCYFVFRQDRKEVEESYRVA
jgi:predicted nucleotidyltransferase